MMGGGSAARQEKRFMKAAMSGQRHAIRAMLKLQGLGMEQSGEFFEKALGQLQAVGPHMRQELLAQEKQGLDKEKASALGTGLTGTTAMSGALRGARASTQRALGGLQESLAGAQAALYQGRGAQVYQEYIDRANIRQRTKYDPFLQNFQMGQMGAAGAKAGAGFGGMLGDIFSMGIEGWKTGDWDW